MDSVPLRKVTARVGFKAGNVVQSRSRPGSPTKSKSPTSLTPSAFHPKAKVNANVTPLRKLSSSSSLSTSQYSNHVSTLAHSRPSSPLRPSRVLQNGITPNSSPKARVMARPTSRHGSSPAQTVLSSQESRQRALTTAPAKFKLPYSEERSRSGSHALSIADLGMSPSPTPSGQPPPSAEPPSVDLGRTNTPPVLAPIKIKSKVTDFVRSASSNAGDSLSRSLSPPYATTRPILTRSRAPSITTLYLNDAPPPTTFYPITTGSPAANPHRYAPRRPPSPSRSHPSPTLSSEPSSAKRSPFVPRVDPTLVPLPPHSPPMSALSVSSKSSVSKTPVSLNEDQMTESHIPSVLSHIHRRSIEWIGNPFLPQVEFKARDRSRSKERSPHDTLHRADSDTESEGSERQLKAEAKTNRKIADLEITNRSLLAINASLETTKNRQAKEIRDLRRKLRESRLILPPRTFEAVTSALDEKEEEEEESDVEGDEDETYQRVKNLIDSLIESGTKALETRPEDFRASLATKVLNADELRSWRDYGQRTSTRTSLTDKQDAETTLSHPSPMVVAISDSASLVELASDTPRSPALPPITITHSL